MYISLTMNDDIYFNNIQKCIWGVILGVKKKHVTHLIINNCLHNDLVIFIL